MGLTLKHNFFLSDLVVWYKRSKFCGVRVNCKADLIFIISKHYFVYLILKLIDWFEKNIGKFSL